MEKFLEAAAIAWNPVGEVRKRLQSGTLSFTSVLAAYVGIVIVCNLFALGAQQFYLESVLHVTGRQMPDHPLIKSAYAQQFMSAVGVLAPLGAVALLPKSVFHPPGRSATLAAILVVAAGWAFYGAAIMAPIYFMAGALLTVSRELGELVTVLLGIPAMIAILALTLFFWFRIMLSILALSGAQVAAITLVALIALGLLTAFFLYIGPAAFPS